MAGLTGAAAMVPPGLALSAAGFEVNRYGVLLARQLTGTDALPVLLALHLLIGMASAIPLAAWWWTRRVPGPVGRLAIGSLYGGAYWLAVNALLLPILYGRPFPWSEGVASVWPSLVVHLVYGTVTASVIGRSVSVRRGRGNTAVTAPDAGSRGGARSPEFERSRRRS